MTISLESVNRVCNMQISSCASSAFIATVSVVIRNQIFFKCK